MLRVCLSLLPLVALRKESVDRNILLLPPTLAGARSLSARRAWIEIPLVALCRLVVMVALRKESVDRNMVNTSNYTIPYCRSPQGERG